MLEAGHPQCVRASFGHSSKTKSILNGNWCCDAAQLGASVTNNSTTTACGWQFCCTDLSQRNVFMQINAPSQSAGIKRGGKRTKAKLCSPKQCAQQHRRSWRCVCVCVCATNTDIFSRTTCKIVRMFFILIKMNGSLILSPFATQFAAPCTLPHPCCASAPIKHFLCSVLLCSLSPFPFIFFSFFSVDDSKWTSGIATARIRRG